MHIEGRTGTGGPAAGEPAGGRTVVRVLFGEVTLVTGAVLALLIGGAGAVPTALGCLAGAMAVGWVLLAALHAARRAADDARAYAVERRRLEAEVAAARAEAAAAREARDAAQGRLRRHADVVASVNHELRTSLGGVIGFTGLLLECELTGEQRDFAETAQRGAESAVETLNDLLDYSMAESDATPLEAVPFAVAGLLHGVAALASPAALERGVALEVQVSPAMPRELHGDAARLRQALLRVVRAALLHMGRGRIVLRGEAAPDGPSGWRARFLVEVSEALPAAFVAQVLGGARPSGAPASSVGGGALGLAISRELARLLGGRLAARGADGHGTVFELAVPLADVVPAPDPAPQPA